MSKNLKRVLAILLALTLFVSFMAGCGKKKDPAENAGDNGGGPADSEFVYVPNYFDIPAEIEYVDYSVLVGDTIYFTTNMPVYPDGRFASKEEIDAFNAEMDEYYRENAAAMPSTRTTTVQTGEAVTTVTETVGGRVKAPESPFTYQTCIFSMKTDGSNMQQLSEFTPLITGDNMDAYSYVYGMKADKDGNLWILENMIEMSYDLPEGFDPDVDNQWEYMTDEKRTYYLRMFSTTGAEMQSICLNETIGIGLEHSYLYEFALDDNGYVYIDGSDGGNIYVLELDGSLGFTLPIDGWLSGFAKTADGSILVVIQSNNGQTQIRSVDTAARKWGQSYDSSGYPYNFAQGNAEYDFFYNDGSVLYGYNLEKGEATSVLRWLNCDIDGNQISFCKVQENGNIILMNTEYTSSSSKTNLIELIKTPRGEVVTKETLTLATLYSYGIRDAVLEFNRTNTQYRIEVIDYSEYNTDEDYTAGMTKLNTEIISGNIPDMICVSELPYDQYAAKGLLEDLNPFIDSDAEFSREDLMQSVLDAMSVDGKLYLISPSFGIITMLANGKAVGMEPGWTVAELQQVIKSNPQADVPLGMYMPREQILQLFLALNMGSYVNWNTGECRFDTQEFKDLLSFANDFPSVDDMDNNIEWVDEGTLIRSGRMIASFFQLSDYDSYQYYKAFFGDDMVFKGLPGGGENGGNVLIPGSSMLAMTSTCGNKEAAWEFMRIFLTEKYQRENVWEFPINKTIFDEKLAEAMKQEYDENGKPISNSSMGMQGGEMVEFFAVTREEADQILAIINSEMTMASINSPLIMVVNDEAKAYFAGEKTIDEVASLIQGKMSIYVNEQR